MAGPTVTLAFAGDADKLSRTMDKVSRDAQTMGDKVGKSSDDLSSRTERGSGRMREAMGLAGAAVAGLAVVGGKHLFDLSKSMEALDVKAKTVFEGELPAMQAWAEANRKAFGDSARNVVGMAANLADLLKPMGFTSAQAATMSKKLLDLSGALSRWSGGTKSAAEVSEILASAMLGETDELKGLGIAISAADIQTRLAAKGQEDLTGAALAQAQAIATQELILEKSTDAQKAWADGGRAAAEAQNGLTSTMAESAEKLAAVVAPVFERLVQILTSVAEWISKNQEAALVIGGLTAAIWLLNAALNANPIILVVTLIAGLVAALVWLWTTSETFRNVVTGVWNTIRDTVTSVVGVIRAAWDGLVNFFAGIPDRIGRALGSLGGIIRDVFKAAVNVMIDGINQGINQINKLIRTANMVTSAAGLGSIGEIPRIPRLHTGGTVPGVPGQEMLAILQAGETVTPAGQRAGGLRITFAGDVDSAFATAFMLLVREGAIQVGD